MTRMRTLEFLTFLGFFCHDNAKRRTPGLPGDGLDCIYMDKEILKPQVTKSC